MLEGDFDGAEGAETIGSSGGELGLVVETLDGAAGDRALGPEPIEQQHAMAAEHAGDFLPGLQARAPRPGAPPIQEAPRPGGGEGGSEELDVFLQEVGPDRLEVVPEEFGQSAFLRLRQVLGSLEQEPAVWVRTGSRPWAFKARASAAPTSPIPLLRWAL